MDFFPGGLSPDIPAKRQRSEKNNFQSEAGAIQNGNFEAFWEQDCVGDQNPKIPQPSEERISLKEIYAICGFDYDEEEEEEESNRSSSAREGEEIFPNLETFLLYLFFQQEGFSRVSVRKMALLLKILKQPCFNLENVPSNMSTFTKISKKIETSSKLVQFGVEV